MFVFAPIYCFISTVGINKCILEKKNYGEDFREHKSELNRKGNEKKAALINLKVFFL